MSISPKSHGAPGVGVDARGGGVIDPTKNVEDLVKALEISLSEFRKSDIKYVDTQLDAAEKLQNYARGAETRINQLAMDAETRLRDALRNADSSLAAAETRRIDQLAQTRQEFQNTIRDMLAESVRTTSTLVSTQLVQIQATFDTRVSKLEAGAFIQAGRSSVADPAGEAAMARMSASIANLASATTDSMNKMANTSAEALAKMSAVLITLQNTGERSGGQTAGSKETNAKILTVLSVAAAIVFPIVTIAIALLLRK